MRVASVVSRTSTAAVVVCAGLAPWPFASVEPFWWALACAISLGAGAIALLSGCAPGASMLPRAAVVAALAPVVVVLFGLLPLPAVVVNALSPGSVAVLQRAGESTVDGWRALSLFPPAGVDALIVLSACVLTAWLVAGASVAAAPRRALSRLFVACGVLIAVFGLAQRLIDPDPQRMFWSIEIYEVGTPFGPYVNRNHFGGAMLLFIGVASGRALAAHRDGRRMQRDLLSAAAALCALALAGTASRGALLGLGVLVMTLLIATPGRARLRLGATLAAAVLLLVAVLATLGLFDELAGRLFHVYGRWLNRFLVQEDALRVAWDFPLFGTGAGTFPWVYHAFQRVDDARHFSDAHSDWVQILMETGLAGVLGVACVVGAFVGAARRGLRATAPARWHAIGPLAGCIGISVHGLVETNLHVPANALLASVAAGLAYGASVGVSRADDAEERDS